MTKTIKEMFEKGQLKLAIQPRKNDYLLKDEIKQRLQSGELDKKEVDGSAKYLDLSKLDKLDGVVVTMIKKEYDAVSPRMWNAVYEKLAEDKGKNYRRIFAVAQTNEETMREFLEAVKNDPLMLGGGAGSGFKDKIIPILKEVGTLDPLVEVAGAANVIKKNPDGTLLGANSDGEGFVEGLLYELGKKNEQIKGKKIVILGAGGTTAAIAYTLVPHEPSEVVIVNRTVSKAQDIADRINGHYKANVIRAAGEDAIPKEIPGAYITVNASDKGGKGPLAKYSAFGKISVTPEGAPDESKFESDLEAALENMRKLPKDAVIADVNLVEPWPMTLEYAKKEGYTRLQDGLEMVARQAVLQFKQRHGDLLPQDTVREIMFREAGLTHE